jgi:hypothetical protein
VGHDVGYRFLGNPIQANLNLRKWAWVNDRNVKASPNTVLRELALSILVKGSGQTEVLKDWGAQVFYQPTQIRDKVTRQSPDSVPPIERGLLSREQPVTQ